MLSNKTVKELKTLAKELNIKGFSKLKKAELIEVIISAQEVKKNPEGVEAVSFKPENTAIAKGYSASANMLVNDYIEGESVLEYGIGTGRNIVYMADKLGVKLSGVDTVEQLEKEKERHNLLRTKGHIIEAVEKNNLSNFDKILNAFVLNVIEADKVKNDIIKDIYNKLKFGGRAYFEVRTRQDVEKAKTKTPHKDGYKIKRGCSYTYQEGISKEKMINLLTTNGFKIVKHVCNSSKHIVIVEK